MSTGAPTPCARSTTDNSFARAWHRILRDGFGVFGASVASLQQAVDNATDAAWVVLLEQGVAGADDAIEVVRRTLAAEMEKVREQDALDSLESTSDDRSVFNRMQEVEAEAMDFAELTNNLLSKAGAPGNLRFEPVGHPIYRGRELRGHRETPREERPDPVGAGLASGARLPSPEGAPRHL